MAIESSILGERIDALVSAGLLSEETPGQYAFRHALLHQAVYASLLVKERKQYHQAIGDTVATLYPDSLDLHLSDLSFHFYAAGVWDKALEYARRAGERAQAMYAPREAVEYFTRALDAARHLQAPILSLLYRERAQALEISGEFEQARTDYESSLAEARAQTDHHSEWEALVGLAFLWASRDYDQTGEYMKQALALARTMGDSGVLGHTLNRLGNWYLNMGAMDQALRHHQEALSLFQQLNDPSGIAESADLLGLTYGNQGNWRESSVAFERAIELFRSLDDRRGLSSALANRSLRGVFTIGDFFIPSDADHLKAIGEAEEALSLSRDIGWRAGEAYALAVLGLLLSSSGQFDRSLDVLTRSLQLSQEIGHRQWTLMSHMGLGVLYLSLLELDRAQEHSEAALALAREVRSTNFARTLSGQTAIVLIRKGDRPLLQRADEVLRAAPGVDLPYSSFGQHDVDNARIELALARGEYAQALDLVNHLMARSADQAPNAVAAHLRFYRAKALVALHRLDESETVLKDLVPLLPVESTRPFRWQVHIALGHVYRRRRRPDESQAQFREARRIIDELAANISDLDLRENFRQRAYAEIPQVLRPADKRRQPVSQSAKAGGGEVKAARRKTARGS